MQLKISDIDLVIIVFSTGFIYNIGEEQCLDVGELYN